MMVNRPHPTSFGLTHFIANIDFACRVFTDQHDGQCRLSWQDIHRGFDAFSHVSGDGFSRNHFSCHDPFLPW